MLNTPSGCETVIDAKRRDVERPEGAFDNHRPFGPWCFAARRAAKQSSSLGRDVEPPFGGSTVIDPMFAFMFHEILRVLERTGAMSPQGSRKTLNGSWNINTCKKTQRNKKFLKFFFFLFLFDCVYVSWDPEGARENRCHEPARSSNSPWANHQKQNLYIFFSEISSQTLCFLRLYGSQTLYLLRFCILLDS
jgi:hypothetical protein